ncbi:hypothetical protein [Stappia sp.]|uniref:HdaA/DnaA family protein n=1 Tax=Stappia sp. TaxID=1870903 RepID=UPI0032D8FC89
MPDGARSGAGQLPLVIPHEAAQERDDFLVGPSNEAAFRLIDSWPDWSAPVTLLAGPVGAGKSHLTHVWQSRSNARRIAASTLGRIDPTELVATGAVAVEDAGRGIDQTALFHLLNAARAGSAHVLITARSWPQAWGLTLPDLASRLRAATPVEILEPDDGLLGRVLVKLFSDRQIDIDPAVVDYLVVRMERSLAAAERLVDALDRTSLARGRRITRPLAAEVMAGMG